MNTGRMPSLCLSIRPTMVAALLLLGGCGGGSGSGSGEVTVVPSGSSTSDGSASATVTAEQREDQRSNSALAANADAAYRAGATGRGIRIAMLDTGIVLTLGEFSGRIDPASADMG